MKPPRDNSTLIFAGPADIDEENMRQLLENWLPSELDLRPPVIPKAIPPRGTKAAGLRKVLAWLEEQFPPDEEGSKIERPADLLAYISDLKSAEDVYLVVLWGQDGDEKTEELVDAAMKRGITVLDLTDGLDELKLADNTPEPPAQEAAPDTPPWKTDEEPAAVPATGPVPGPPRILTGESTLAALLATAFEAAAAALRAEASADSPAANGTTPASNGTAADNDTTRSWLKNPGLPDNDPGAYVYKGRGRPRNEMRNWPVVKLTQAQEQALGLKVPA